MDASTIIALLIALLVGLTIGVLATWAVMRERVRAVEGQLGSRSQDLQVLASQAVQASSQQLLTLASERFERDSARREAMESARSEQLSRVLSPLAETMQSLERSVARTEQARSQAEGSLQAHLRHLSHRTEELDRGTQALVAALKAPTSRGQWGEVQLRRIVEAAGMLEHTDFSLQSHSANVSGDTAQRPDLVVHLSSNRTIVVDAKAPMDAYLRAMNHTEAAARTKDLQAHARALHAHVKHLSSKAYWASLGDSPEFVVMFVPSDGLLAGALEADPGILDNAFMNDVVIASPATLMALLRTVAHTWRTDALNNDALRVLESGREVHKRLGTLASHLQKLGRSLDTSVKTFNDVVGSYQSRVLPAARAMEDLGVVGSTLEELAPVTQRARDAQPSEDS